MSQEATVLMMVKGVIFDLSPEDQKKVKSCAEKIRETVAEAGTYGSVALALVAAEAAAAA